MNLKSMFTGVAIAASVVTASAAVSAPADAATFDFSGNARLEQNNPLGKSTLNFRQVPGGYATPIGTAADQDFNQFQISDLILNGTSTPWNLNSVVVPPFLSGLGIVPNGGSFNLTSFSLTQLSNDFFGGVFTGIFANGTAGTGTFTSQSANFLTVGTSYSAAIDYVAVPTPALLPGLLGLGVAALRKRKGEGSEAEKETVGVKA